MNTKPTALDAYLARTAAIRIKLAQLQQMADEGASFGRMLGEPAAKEAFTAFMERRKPDFSKV